MTSSEHGIPVKVLRLRGADPGEGERVVGRRQEDPGCETCGATLAVSAPEPTVVDAEWPWFSRPFELDGVLLTWRKAMRGLLVRPGPYEVETVELIGAGLDERLRPAS